MFAAGTYTTTYTAAAGNSATCSTPSTAMTTYPIDSGTGDVPAGCTETCNVGMLSETCSTTTNGVTAITVVFATYTSTGATGTVTYDVTAADGGAIANCAYTFAITKN